MNKTDVITLLASVKRVRSAFADMRAHHDAEVTTAMRRLVLEGATHYLSAEEMGDAAGYTAKAIRSMLRNEGVDPRLKKTMLSKHAAKTLSDNAALMSVEPGDLLLSPLAYLPAGPGLVREVQDAAVSQVTEVEEIEDDDLRTAVSLLRKMMFLRQYGENAPGHMPGEDWRTLETEVETFTRGVVGL